MEQSIKDILQTIDDAIDGFQGAMPAIQKQLFDELQPMIKELALKNGNLINNVTNLKLIGDIQNKLKKIITTSQYKDEVQKFIDSFSAVSNLQLNYFKQFNQKYTPNKTLPIVKQLAIESTINDLIGEGMNNNILAPIKSILNQNITTGGSYADFNQQLRDWIIGTDKNDGNLVKYTKQMTTDAIHQYNAQYHEIIAQDLKFNWGQYVGSLITTSREFCVYLTKKRWVHKSELPTIIEGHIDDHDCKLSNTTGLPYGMIPGTNSDNFKVRRGGYSCRHGYYMVPDSSVPKDIIAKFGNKDAATIVATEEKNKVDNIKENNKTALKDLQDKGIVFYDDVAEHWPEDIKIKTIKSGSSYYDVDKHAININTGSERTNNEYYQKKIMLHEGAHAMHINDGIVTMTKSSPGFDDFYKKANDIIKGKGPEIERSLRKIMSDNYGDQTIGEQVSIYADTLGGLTKGKYGWGHTQSYYKRGNLGKMEVFAHAVTVAKLDNPYSDINATIGDLSKLMKSYGLSVLKGV